MALEGQGSDSAGSSAPEKPELVPPPAAAAAAATATAHVPLVELKFLEKLRRRNVGRVALLYVGICWIILEPVHVVFHMLAVPEWINRLVVVGMALVFHVEILIAEIYEVTPEGLKPSTAVDPRHSLLQHTGGAPRRGRHRGRGGCGFDLLTRQVVGIPALRPGGGSGAAGERHG